jgi:hypothetical protein
MKNIAEAFTEYDTRYRELSRMDGLEITSLAADEFERATGDPETTLLEHDSIIYPVLTPMDNLEWYNQSYFQKAIAASGRDPETPLYYYDHLSDLYQKSPANYIEVIAPALAALASKGAVIGLDHLNTHEQATFEELETILSASGVRQSEDIMAAFDPTARHFNIASETRLTNPANIRSDALTFWEAADLIEADLGEGVSLEPTLSDKEFEQIWPFYQQRFSELTDSDPLVAISPKEELLAMARNEQLIKAVQRIGGKVACMCIYGDVREFPWANQEYYQKRYPEEYEQGGVLFFPGTITDPNSDGNALKVMAPVGRLVNAAGIERSLMTFVCNRLSKKPITTIGTFALKRTGTVADLTQTVSERIFRAYALEPGGTQ